MVAESKTLRDSLSHTPLVNRARRPRKSQDRSKKRPISAGQPGDRGELIGLLWKAARRGNVPAMRILLQEMKAETPPEQPKSVIDELATRRHAR